MRRYLFIAFGLSILILAATGYTASAAVHGLREAPAWEINSRYVCVPSLMWRNPELCPSYGPGTTAYRLASIHLPDPLPELPVIEFLEEEGDELLPHTFAHVNTIPVNVYRHPMEAATGLPPVRTMLSGDWWVSVDGRVEYDGQQWYQINEEEFVPADVLALASPSRFQGAYFTEQPQHPFAWVNRWMQASVTPQGALNPAVEALQRYQLVTIFAEERRGDEIWYLVGPDQWVEQQNVSRADVDVPPSEVGPAEKWIEVDLFEQTIAAYEGARLVYATMISSGRTSTSTPPGVYRTWAKVREGKMSNPDVEDGSPAYYYIEDVPWTLYFHEGYSIHATFWHDAFGFLRSHGCVNLSPSDAKWFFNWSDPWVPEGADQVYIDGSMPSTWVWVHFSSPF